MRGLDRHDAEQTKDIAQPFSSHATPKPAVCNDTSTCTPPWLAKAQSTCCRGAHLVAPLFGAVNFLPFHQFCHEADATLGTAEGLQHDGKWVWLPRQVRNVYFTCPEPRKHRFVRYNVLPGIPSLLPPLTTHRQQLSGQLQAALSWLLIVLHEGIIWIPIHSRYYQVHPPLFEDIFRHVLRELEVRISRNRRPAPVPSNVGQLKHPHSH